MRQTMKRLRWARRLMGLTLLWGLSVWGYYFVTDQLLGVRYLSIQTHGYIKAEQLVQECEQYLGKNGPVWIWSGRITSALKDRFPQLETVQVQYQFPDTMLVAVIETQPWASFIVDNASIIVSKQGYVLDASTLKGITRSSKNKHSETPVVEASFVKEARTYGPDQVTDLVIVKGVGRESFSAGQVSVPVMEKVMRITNQIQAHFPGKVFQLAFKGQEITFVLEDVLPIWLGEEDRLNEKLEQLVQFLAYRKDKGQREMRYIDMRVPNKVIVDYQDKSK